MIPKFSILVNYPFNIINVNFDKFNASLLNKLIHFIWGKKRSALLNDSEHISFVTLLIQQKQFTNAHHT